MDQDVLRFDIPMTDLQGYVDGALCVRTWGKPGRGTSNSVIASLKNRKNKRHRPCKTHNGRNQLREDLACRFYRQYGYLTGGYGVEHRKERFERHVAA